MAPDALVKACQRPNYYDKFTRFGQNSRKCTVKKPHCRPDWKLTKRRCARATAVFEAETGQREPQARETPGASRLEIPINPRVRARFPSRGSWNRLIRADKPLRALMKIDTDRSGRCPWLPYVHHGDGIAAISSTSRRLPERGGKVAAHGSNAPRPVIAVAPARRRSV